MYKAILFDMDNTLVDYDQCELNAMKLAVRRHHLFEEEEAVWDSFWELFLKSNFTYWVERFARKLSNVEVIERALHDALEPFGKQEYAGPAARDYWDIFCNSCYFEKGAKDVLQSLHGKFKLGIISNGAGEAQHSRLQSGGVYDYFEAVIVSDEAGVWKPDPQIFQAALDALKMKREEVLYVGDSLTDDYAGARNAGVDFCLYNRKGLLSDEIAAPDYVIQELPEILEIMKPS